MAKQKIEFKIKVKEIGNGFIVSMENVHGINWEENFCEDREAIILQLIGWVDKMLKPREEKGK